MQNSLQLNPDKLEALIIGTSNQLHTTSIPSSVSVAGSDLPAAEDMKVLGLVLDRRLSFDHHATSVARVCNFHARAIQHVRHLLTTKRALTLVQSYTVSAGLLQHCVARCLGQQHSEATAHSEHRGTNYSAGTMSVAILTSPGTVTLAASLPVN